MTEDDKLHMLKFAEVTTNNYLPTSYYVVGTWIGQN